LQPIAPPSRRAAMSCPGMCDRLRRALRRMWLLSSAPLRGTLRVLRLLPNSEAEPLLEPADDLGAAVADQAQGQPGSEAPASLNALDLARVLGNSVPDPAEQPDSDGDDSDEPQPEDEESGPSGQELLDALEGEDSTLAELQVRGAGRRAVNFTDGPRRSALLLAAMEGHHEACRLLLLREDFQHTNARNTIGSTALHLAAANGHREIVQLLLSCPRFSPAGGINAENNNGQTALDFAVEFGEGVAKDLLLDAGARTSDRSTRRGRYAPVVSRQPGGATERIDEGEEGEEALAEDEDQEGVELMDSLD